MTRTEPSEQWSHNIDSLLDDLYSQVLDQIGTARKLDRQETEAAFAECLSMTDQQYVQRRLVDRLVARDLSEATAEHFGDGFKWVDMNGSTPKVGKLDNPFALFSQLFQPRQPTIRRTSIALVHATGLVTMGPGLSGSGRTGLFGVGNISGRALDRALGAIESDGRIKGVVLRIDSPGGSALASEVVWQAVRDLAQKKPVYVSVGPLAASGGYYIACAGSQIYVSPTTMLGSIGVVGGKLVMGGLYEKIGLNVHRRSRGPLGDMFNSVEPFNDQQREALRGSMARVYEQFTQRVVAGRGKRIKDIDAVAQGRLFTGRQAVENGLADRLGGVEVAIEGLAKDLNLEPGSYDVVTLPPPPTLGEFLDRLFRTSSSSPSLAGIVAENPFETAGQVLGHERWRAARSILAGMMLTRDEPVLTLMLTAIVVR